MSGRTPPTSETAYARALGIRLRNARICQGLSLWQLAGQVGVSYQQLQKYECGTNRAGIYRLQLIARALHVPLVSLIPPLDGLPATPPGEISALLRKRRLMKLIDRVDQAGVDDVVQLLEHMARPRESPPAPADDLEPPLPFIRARKLAS